MDGVAGQGSTTFGGNMEQTMRMFEAFQLYMEQRQGVQRREALVSKALHSIVDKEEQFDGRDVTRFLRIYAREMELNNVSKREMVASFELASIPEIRERIGELKENHGESWESFSQVLKEEFFMEDSERVTKRSFLEWITRPNKGLGASELLREFERQYGQLSTIERTTLDVEKIELFIQAADPKLQEKLEPLLEDREAERGLKTDWKEVVGAVSLLAKRQRRRDKSVIIDVKPPSSSKSSNAFSKIDGSTVDELVKGIQELKIKMTKLEEKGHSSEGALKESSAPKSTSTGRGLPLRCMWCDSFAHSRRDCKEFTEALDNKVVVFKEGKIHLKDGSEPLETNFGRGGMKALVYGISKEAKTYGVSIDTPEQVSMLWPSAKKFAEKEKINEEVLVHAGKSIRETTGWNDPVDALSVHAYIARVQHEAIMEEKRKRDDAHEGASKRATRSDKTRQQTVPTREESMPDAVSSSKEKGKGPAYKLQSDIEAATDLKKVLEDRILSGKVEFTLGEVLGIAKREFHEVIIDIIKRKRQTTVESIPSNAHVSRVAKDDDEYTTGDVSLLERRLEESDKAPSHYANNHWARATTETLVKLGDLEEPIVALIDHGSEINLISRELQEKGNWPIDLDHGWLIRAANNSRGDLYGACPNVKVTIGDVSDEQHFFVQDRSTYPIILGQPYITATRMETKVMDNGSAYARIRSRDGKKAIQFLTVCANHERNRSSLRERPLPKVHKEFRDFDDLRDFHHMPF